MELETMSIKEALRNGVKHFNCNRACKDCGSKERYIPDGLYEAFCAVCFPIIVTLSASKIKVAQNKHNANVTDKKKRNWSIGKTVSSGIIK